MKLGAAEKEILAALDRIMALPLAAKPNVLVEDTITGRFVQFCTIPGEKRNEKQLLIDLPLSHEKGNAQLLTARSFELATLVLGHSDINRFDTFTSFTRRCADTSDGARLAMVVLRRVLDLPDEAELTIDVNVKPEYEAN